MFKELLSDMQKEMDIQSNRLDHLTSSSFDWLKNIREAIQQLVIPNNINENEQQEIELDTTSQTESIILPEENNCLTLRSQANELVDILSSESESNEINDKLINDSNEQNKAKVNLQQPTQYSTSKENLPSNGSISMCSSCASISLVTSPDSDLLSNDSDLFDEALATPSHFEISGFASELTTSAQIFRQKWKESISQNNT